MLLRLHLHYTQALITQMAQTAGLIHWARGHIMILDRAGLEKRSCECYSVVKKEYARLLPDEPAT